MPVSTVPGKMPVGFTPATAWAVTPWLTSLPLAGLRRTAPMLNSWLTRSVGHHAKARTRFAIHNSIFGVVYFFTKELFVENYQNQKRSQRLNRKSSQKLSRPSQSHSRLSRRPSQPRPRVSQLSQRLSRLSGRLSPTRLIQMLASLTLVALRRQASQSLQVRQLSRVPV